ncbi:unnamed protein product [Sphenostylis stenocarpa]|uniref:GDT1 family protein n=1 Tax=Sphenostylis stenocarpa TaxID=92480 RepID=A0AA86TH74_9FABA|nr:unnamed protein product [Sphenostylis stenocarpa]
MKGLGIHTPLVSRGKPPPSPVVVDALPSSSHFTRTTILFPLKLLKSMLSLSSCSCTSHMFTANSNPRVSDIMPELYTVRSRQKSGLSFACGTIRAQASNISGVEPGDYGSNEKNGHNVFENNAIDDSSSKVVKPPDQIPYPLSIAFVLLGCALVFSLIAFVIKGGPSSVLAALAKSGFTAAFTLIFVSEIGDKTFFIAALLAMQFEKGLVLLGSMGALGLMSILSVVIGRIFQSVPAQFQTTLPIGEYAAVTLLLFFGLKSIKDAWDLPSDVVKKGDNSSPELDELAEAEELVKEKVSKRLSNPFEIVWKSFSLVFFAEWGDRSMLATIALGAAQSPWGVASGAIAGHLLATSIAILGGAFLANYISEKLVGYLGGGLFLIFAGATFLGVF